MRFAPELRPTEFVTAMQHWCQVVDDERRQRDPNAKFDQRFLELHKTFDGHSNLDGFLDQEAAALLERALAKIMGPPDPRNGPSRRERRGNAEPTRSSTWPVSRSPTRHPAGMSPPTSTPSTTSTPSSTTNRMLRNAAARSSGAATPSAAARRHERRSNGSAATPASPGWSWPATPKSSTSAARHRFPTAAQFRALVLRDRHCQFPGCDRPPEWTDAHHLIHWLHGGTTDLDNLVLLCRYHHVTCHEGDWTLHREPDGHISATPPPEPWERPPPRGSPLDLAA